MPNVFKKYDVILFDLDDTLYPEIEYLQAVFGAIGQFFEKKYALNAWQLEEFLTTTFIKHGRQSLFNQCFNHFKEEISSKTHQNTEGVSPFQISDCGFRQEPNRNPKSEIRNNKGVLLENIFVEHCLNILRTVEISEKIHLFPYAYALIPQLLKENKQIFVLTNGNVSQQKNKINSLNWKDFADSITFVFANEFAPKPSSKVFTDFLDPHFKLKNKTMLFIGDAETDAQFSQNIGIDFLHVDFFK